jgi:hypothetical protein
MTKQAGCPADADKQYAGGHRVQRARMTDPPGAGKPANSGHHVV